MGIRFACPNGHKLNVKEELAGKRAICPSCGVRIVVPSTNQLPASEVTSPPLEGASSANLIFPSTALPPAADDVPAGTEPEIDTSPPVAVPLVTPPTVPLPFPMSAVADDPLPVTDVPTETGPVIQYMVHRRRRRQTQMTIALVLLFAVVVLAIVLVWVLQRGPDTTPQPAQSGSPAAMSLRPVSRHMFLTNVDRKQWRSKDREVPA